MDRKSGTGIKNWDEKQWALCLSRLKEWHAPLGGWYCREVIDVREDDPEAPLAVCELCGCSSVRYVHVMENDQYFEAVEVGCICAGIMEGDVLGAQERERPMRNRARQRRSFLQRRWEQAGPHRWTCMYRKRQLCIFENEGKYTVRVWDRNVWKHKGKLILDFQSAAKAVFDLIESGEKTQ